MGRAGFTLRTASPRWWVTVLVLVGATVALYARQGPERDATVLTGPTMGTRYRVVVPAGGDADALKAAVEAQLDRVVGLMSTYVPDSELSRFNRSTSTAAFAIAPETRAVVRVALEVGRRSDGAFDVTVGPLVDRWGFGKDGRPESIPTDDELAALLQTVGSDRLRLQDAGLAKTHPETRVDLSAVAKGYAVDRVAEALEAAGVEDYLVEVGGEVRVRGHRADGRPFRVAVERPDADARDVHAVVELASGALATSGNYRNFFDRDGIRYSHTLDPRTGRPVQHRLLSASVLHESCAHADAWATALMASGDRAWSLAEREKLQVLLLYARPDGGLEERVTEAFAKSREPRP